MGRVLGSIDRTVWLIAGAVVAVLLLLATRYGWHSDEFYYVKSGQRLAWGYVDNPPLVPAIARLATAIAPHNLFVLRIFPAFVAGATVVMGSVVVRELGGSREATVLGAAVTAAGAFVLGVGHLLATPGFDVLAWLGLVAITARLLRSQDPRWWVAFGLLAGVAMLNKNLVAMLVVGLGVGLVVERPWSLLRSAWVVVGAAIALAICAPHLVWQAQHGWPQFEFARALEERIGLLNRVTLVPFQVLFVGPAFVLVGWRGARWLWSTRPYRVLLWAWVVVFVLVFLAGGRPYYVVPLTTVLVLAGVAPSLERGSVRSIVTLIVPNLVIGVLFALPILPVSAAKLTGSLNETVAQTIGWRDLAQQVRGARDALPVADRRDAIVLTEAYGEAGALDFYRREYDLPPVYSPHNSYADFGQPSDDNSVVITIRFSTRDVQRIFTDCRVVGKVTNHLGVPNEIFDTPIHVCRGLRRPWSVTWDRLRFFA